MGSLPGKELKNEGSDNMTLSDGHRVLLNRRIPEPVIAGIITLLVFLVTIAVKGIFPFGEYRIDYYDMGQEYAPVYYHIWDYLHGKGALFYNWYIEEGQNFTMCRSLLSLFNLFFLIIPRQYVLHSLSIFLAIHLFFMSVNINLFLSRTVPSKKLYRVILSVSYGLCGYTLTHYTVPPFMDVAALAPVYLLTLANTLKMKRVEVPLCRIKVSSILPYAIMTGYMTILSYYLEFMNLLFILMISGTYILILCPKQERKPVTSRLCIGTLSGILLSSWILIPTVLQLTRTTRIKENTNASMMDTVLTILRAVGADMYYIKWWQLSGSIVAIVAIIIGVIRYRKERKENLFFLLVCWYPCALIPFESINMIFHLGIYYQYPIRCGYWIPLMLLSAGAYYLSKISEEYDRTQSGAQRVYLTVLFCVVSICICISTIVFYLKHDTWDIHELFRAWTVFAVFLAMMYTCVILAVGQTSLIVYIIAVEIICCSYVGYGMPHFHDDYSSQPEQSGDYIIESQIIKENLGIEESKLNRIKNPDTALNANYGMVINRACVGGNYEGATEDQRKLASSLGYSIHFIRILDSGGTIFTDALFHVTQVLTCIPFFCENDAYELIDKKDGFELYDSNYTFPYAIAVSSDLSKVIFPSDVRETHNMLYRAISGKMEDVMAETHESRIRVDGKKALYITGSYAERVTVNGFEIPVPSIGELQNTAYPAEFNCNLLFAGIYDNEVVEIKGMEDAVFYTLDLEAIGDLCDDLRTEKTYVEAKKNGMIISISGSDERDMMLLPVCYDSGFRAVVNGRVSDVYNIGGTFMGVPLNNGENHIELLFVPTGMILGSVISALTFIILFISALKTIEYKGVDNVSLYVFWGMWWALLSVLYIIPIIAFAIHQLAKRLHFIL